MGLDWTFEKKDVGGHFVRVRLDRALASASWCSLFPQVAIGHLTAVKFDHSPYFCPLSWMRKVTWSVVKGSHSDMC
jgi:hypothetical protein